MGEILIGAKSIINRDDNDNDDNDDGGDVNVGHCDGWVDRALMLRQSNQRVTPGTSAASQC